MTALKSEAEIWNERPAAECVPLWYRMAMTSEAQARRFLESCRPEDAPDDWPRIIAALAAAIETLTATERFVQGPRADGEPVLRAIRKALALLVPPQEEK